MQQNRPRYVTDRPAYNLPDFDREFEKKTRQFPVGDKVKKLFRYSVAILHTNFLWRALCSDPTTEKPIASSQRLMFVCQVLRPSTEGLVVSTPACPQLASQVQSKRQPAVWCHQRGQRRHHSGSPGSVCCISHMLPWITWPLSKAFCFSGMAFALLANLPPVNGLYSSFFPLIPYFFLGTAHQMVPGKNDLLLAVSYDDSDWLLRSALLGSTAQLAPPKRKIYAMTSVFRYLRCPQHYGGNCVS